MSSLGRTPKFLPGGVVARVARPYRGGMTENTHLVVETQDLGKRYGERIVAVDG